MTFSIASYSDLQDRIARRAGGSSDSQFADGVREAIHLAESELNTKLRVPEMIVRSRETVNERWESAPTDFLELRQAFYVTSDDDALDVPLSVVSPERVGWLDKTVRGVPKSICFTGLQYRIAPKEPDTEYQVRLIYYGKVADLSDTNPCTVLLNRYPLLYLNGALANLEAWLVGDERLPVWRTMFERQIAEANAANGRRMRGWAA